MINELRNKIDKLDDKIIKILVRRQKLSKKIAEIKRKDNIPIINEEREKEIIEKAKKTDKLNPDFVENLFRTIIGESRKVQEETK